MNLPQHLEVDLRLKKTGGHHNKYAIIRGVDVALPGARCRNYSLNS